MDLQSVQHLNPVCTCLYPDALSIEDVSNLKINLPGEVVQIFSNYRVKLANSGDLAKDQIKNLQDLIYESYKSNYVFLAESITLAVQRMEK